ncbi:MAG: hypothetical protein BZ135_01060 [Methanosphaera sp. rholeuAM6]|nr:MAG: hypothetical protein BZ135_01060 [Methanosphaera sp. rholeuAM6]
MNSYEVTMKLDDVDFLTQRKLMIPSDLTFKKFHEIVSLVFNLDSEEKYKFIFNDINLEIRDTGRINRDTIDSRYEKIDKYFQAFKNITYENTFWRVIIKVEEKKDENHYPRIISVKGVYNPNSSISSTEEFSSLLKLKKSKAESSPNDLKRMKNLVFFNRNTMERELFDMFGVSYEIRKRKVVVIDKRNTLDNLL